jgi:hypothetical protein
MIDRQIAESLQHTSTTFNWRMHHKIGSNLKMSAENASLKAEFDSDCLLSTTREFLLRGDLDSARECAEACVQKFPESSEGVDQFFYSKLRIP